MALPNPIVEGNVLTIPAIQSPNFVHNLSGWKIAQDGSAEFSNLTLSGSLPPIPINDLTTGTLGATATIGAGGIQTAPAGANRVVLDANGFRAYDPSGLNTVDLEAATGQISATGSMTVTDPVSGDSLAVLDNTGNLTAQSAFFSSEAFIEGDALVSTAAVSPNIPRIPGGGQNGVGGGLLDSMGYGLVASGPFLVSGGRAVAPGVIWGLCSQAFQAEEGRMYVFRINHVKIVGTVTGGFDTISLRANMPTFSGDQSAAAVAVNGGTFMGYIRTAHFNATYDLFGDIGPLRCGAGLEIPFAGLVQLAIDLTAGTQTTTYNQPASNFPYFARFDVYDIGPIVPSTSGFLDVGSGSSTAPTHTFTKTYVCSDSGTYDSGNAFISSFGKEIIQGDNQGTGGSFGACSGMAIFPSMVADLTGATIAGMSFTIHNHHWWFNDGGTVDIGYHGNTALPGTFNVGSWPKVTQKMAIGATKTFNIDSSNWASFQSGAFRGLSFHPPSSSATYYGRFDGQGYSSPPKITVTYSK